MKPHEERVVVEKQELDEKIAKLKVFAHQGNLTFTRLPAEDRILLKDQLAAMWQYSAILGRRIERFVEPGSDGPDPIIQIPSYGEPR